MMVNLEKVLSDLHSVSAKKIILDTDAANEIDDQFAIAYAMRSQTIDFGVNAAHQPT